MSAPRDIESFAAGFAAGFHRDFSALMRACAAPPAWLRHPPQRPTQAERDHFHRLLATAMTERPGVRMSWREPATADVTGYLARESIRRSSLRGFI